MNPLIFIVIYVDAMKMKMKMKMSQTIGRRPLGRFTRREVG